MYFFKAKIPLFLRLCEEPLPEFDQLFAVTMLRWQCFILFCVLPVYPKNLTNHKLSAA